MAAPGRYRRPDRGRGRHPEGDGLRHHRRPAGAGRPLHGVRADGRLRGARHVAPAQRQHDDDHRDPDARPSSARPRPAAIRGADRGRARRWPCWSARCCCSRRVLRLGFVANFISEPVLTGFKSGIGLVIVVDQMPKLLGVHIEKSRLPPRPAGASFAQLPADVVAHAGCSRSRVLALIFGARALRAARAGAADRDRRRRSLRRRCFGLATLGVATVGAIPRGLPPLVLAAASTSRRAMWPAAAGIALMSFTETHRRRARVRRARRAAPDAEPGAAGARRRPTSPAASSAPCRPAAARRRPR